MAYTRNSGGSDVVGNLLIAVVIAAFVFLCGLLAGFQLASQRVEPARGETPSCRLVE